LLPPSTKIAIAAAGIKCHHHDDINPYCCTTAVATVAALALALLPSLALAALATLVALVALALALTPTSALAHVTLAPCCRH
jgi:hypothetical protein